MIHGETRIVLRNPISNNIIKDVTSENTFQSGVIQQFMRGCGMIGNRLRAQSVNEGEYDDYPWGYHWHNVLGGILLFRDQIPVGDLYMNAGNQMVGNGAWKVANSDIPNEMGSYNAQESSDSLGAITQVYDFATNQANGRISCVCLTSQTGGYIGYGNPSGGVIASSKAKSMFEYTERVGVGSGHTFRNNKRFSFSYDGNTHILTVTKLFVPVTQSSIKNNMKQTLTFDLSNVGTFSSDIGIRAISQDGKYAYISYYANSQYTVADGGTIKYYKYDMDTDTLTQESFINSTGVTLYGGDGFMVANGCAFVGKYNAQFVEVINLTTGVHVKEIPYASSYGAGNMTSGGLVIVNHATDDRPSVYDPVADTVYPTNARWDLSYGQGRYTMYDESSNMHVWRGYDSSIGLFNPPWYLATINNLQNAVTKTAAQTMKVTYTLTEA